MDFGKLFNADGRVGRKDWIVWIVAHLRSFSASSDGFSETYDDGGSLTLSILSIIAGIAGIFMGIKRLHDLDKSGWLYLLALVPIVNFFFVIYLWLFKGTLATTSSARRRAAARFPALHSINRHRSDDPNAPVTIWTGAFVSVDFFVFAIVARSLYRRLGLDRTRPPRQTPGKRSPRPLQRVEPLRPSRRADR